MDTTSPTANVSTPVEKVSTQVEASGPPVVPYRGEWVQIWVVGLTAALIAITSASFSVYGIARLFAGAFTATLVMGSVLEIGKFVSASFLHWHWRDTGKLLKTYLVSAVIVLMLITSMGVYGFLSSAYQRTSFKLESVEQTTASLLEQKERQIARKKNIDDLIAATPNNYVTAKRRLIKQYEPEIKEINASLDEIYKKIAESKQDTISTGTDIGPIIFIAKTFGLTNDTVAQVFIIAFVVVFDPLAVCLVLCLNFLLARSTNRYNYLGVK